MLKNLPFILLFLLLSNKSFSQHNTNIQCPDVVFSKKKPSWHGNNDILKEYIKKFPLLDFAHTYYNVPLTFHFFLNPRENTQILNKDIKLTVRFLNKIYKENNTGIQFYIADILYYKKNNHLKSGYSIESFFLGRKDKNVNSINIYYINTLELNLFIKKKYYYGMHNSITNSIMIIRHSTKTTLAHEIGHFFGLKHPHNNWKKGKSKQECVSRTRKKANSNVLICEANGDYISDTPAEPNLKKTTNNNCDYIGLNTDNWGDKYKPNTNNIMSYLANSECRTSFTHLQKAAMLYTISTLKNSENWIRCPVNKIYSFDRYEPDDAMSMASRLVEEKKQYHTFNYLINYKNELKVNNIDWLFININANKRIKINVEKANNNFPTFTLFVFNSSFKCILTKEINSPNEIILNLNIDRYYIKIEGKLLQKPELLDFYISYSVINN